MSIAVVQVRVRPALAVALAELAEAHRQAVGDVRVARALRRPDGECGTGNGLNNCGGWDVYRKSANGRSDFPIKIKADAECRSGDEWLGSFSTLEKCAAACAAKTGCEYFLYGKASGPQGSKAGRCYWEKTSDSSCSSGSWEADSYDFYGFKSANGWSRMEGCGQGGTGSPYPDGGYTYHYGTAQPCTSCLLYTSDAADE